MRMPAGFVGVAILLCCIPLPGQYLPLDFETRFSSGAIFSLRPIGLRSLNTSSVDGREG